MIIRFLKKRQKHKSELPKTVRTIRDIELTIIRNLAIHSEVSISKDDEEKIAQIICEEKDKSSNCGYIIAERVAKEVNTEICSVDVEGSEDGKRWTIKLSDVPF